MVIAIGFAVMTPGDQKLDYEPHFMLLHQADDPNLEIYIRPSTITEIVELEATGGFSQRTRVDTYDDLYLVHESAAYVRERLTP